MCHLSSDIILKQHIRWKCYIFTNMNMKGLIMVPDREKKHGAKKDVYFIYETVSLFARKYINKQNYAQYIRFI